MRVLYRAGDIIEARDVPDTSGGNHKDRPVLVMRDILEGDEEFLALGITTSFSHPIPAHCVLLSYGTHGRCRTGLTEESVINGHWFICLPTANIRHRRGHAGEQEYRDAREIARKKVLEGRG